MTEDAGDEDGIINLDVDPPYKRFLIPGNYTSLFDMNGALHLEIICHRVQASSFCAQDPHPLREPLPKVGQRIWAEGRWVIDSGKLAELHPVYRWEVVK